MAKRLMGDTFAPKPTTNFKPSMPFGQFSQADGRSSFHFDTTDDELLSDLALASENIRARQVFEWELKRRSTGLG